MTAAPLLLAAVLAVGAQDAGAARAAARLHAAEAAVSAVSRANDGFFLDPEPGAPGLLEAQWGAVRRWLAAWLDEHPRAGPAEIAAAAKGDKDLELTAVRLDDDALLVSAETGAFGTAFILRRAADGRHVTALALDEPATFAAPAPPQVAAWRSDRAGSNCRDNRPFARWAECGPLAPQLVRLADEAGGARRFAVIGTYAQEAGATQGLQVSFWRWNGRTAEPLRAATFSQMADDPVVARTGPHALVLRAKGDWTRLFACGACSGRRTELTFALPPQGVDAPASRSLTPELDRVDALYDALFRGRPTSGLADPAVAHALADTVRQEEGEALRLKLRTASLGLLDGWRLERGPSSDTLCLETDGAGAQVFALDRRSLRITAVRPAKPGACEGEGSRG